jgi:hypothetical protein
MLILYFKNVTKPKREQIKYIKEKLCEMIENSITIDTTAKKTWQSTNNSDENEHSIKSDCYVITNNRKFNLR